jgi:hypothetical protein
MLGLRSQHIPSVLDDVDEDAMAPGPIVTGSSGGGTRGSGGDGESVGLPAAVHASGDRTGLWLLFSRTMIIGMRATYRHMAVGAHFPVD